jgi:hypothetical protein
MNSPLNTFHTDLVSQLQLLNPGLCIPDAPDAITGPIGINDERLQESELSLSDIKPKAIETCIENLQSNIISNIHEKFPDIILPDDLSDLGTNLLNSIMGLRQQTPNGITCSQILISGKNKGNACSNKVKTDSLCYIHYKKHLSKTLK